MYVGALDRNLQHQSMCRYVCFIDVFGCLRWMWKNAHTPAQACLCDSVLWTTFVPWKPLRTFRESQNFVLIANKQIQLNHDDALAKPNIQRRACCLTPSLWLTAQPLHVIYIRPSVFVTASRRPAQETINIINASPWRSRSCIVVEASSNHQGWCALHQANKCLALAIHQRCNPRILWREFADFTFPETFQVSREFFEIQSYNNWFFFLSLVSLIGSSWIQSSEY